MLDLGLGACSLTPQGAHRVRLLPTSQSSSSPVSDASSAAQEPATADDGPQDASPTGSRLQHDRAAKSAAKPFVKGKGKKGGEGKVPAPVGNNNTSGWESEQPYALCSSGEMMSPRSLRR